MKLLRKTILTAAFALIFAGLLPSYALPKGGGTFEIGNKEFLLNGQPFVVKAAEIHYPRIPAHYWEHRIEMCKAMGMNTICIYLFWNIHEQEPGQFDFKGQNDISRFCRLAQKHGMQVIVRPGPYVCAEWEMGGLPWWLLKKEDIELRSNDPYFLERTKLFITEVGRQLADQQISRGGNILMVQVENEFGAYAQNKEYVSNIRDMVRGAGFTDVPLFQCDWSSTFDRNGLDDLLWTINFGSGANIEKQFERLAQQRPNTPLMCSEYWSGWFDHWGRHHETRSAESLTNGLRDMLDRNISFSLYMAHGGTTFGHWGGANAPPYSAMCSSYDYDAPISEAGHVTEKFHAVRELMGKYLPTGEYLPAIPETPEVIAIPKFELNAVAPLFANLPKPLFSERIKPMEEFDQGWGTILYRTVLDKENATTEALLTIDEPHDWAQVFIDGSHVGTLDRRRGEKTLLLPVYRSGAVLDILVEAMGRVNFGRAIHDHKGITEKVSLTADGKTNELFGWQVYNFPVDYDFGRSRIYVEAKAGAGAVAPAGPAYYKGSFRIDKLGDTFLDMQHWGKGMVWVNGHALGRFWKIGPQQTLYMPGCWLKKGKNEIVVLDLAGPRKSVVEGVTKPLLDLLRADESLLHRKEGQTLDLSAEKPVIEGTFKPGNGWQEVRFAAPHKVRYFCLEALSSHQGDGFTSIAEIDLLDQEGNPLSRMKWRVTYADSEEVSAANNSANKVYDLQESTFWHTAYRFEKPAHPHQIVIDLGETASVTGFRYLPRAEQNAPGMIKEYRIFLKTTSFNY